MAFGVEIRIVVIAGIVIVFEIAIRRWASIGVVVEYEVDLGFVLVVEIEIVVEIVVEIARSWLSGNA